MSVCYRVSKTRQFQAVLWKNYLLQTRVSKAWYSFGAVSWMALLIEIAIPGVFFALTCIPKHYVQPFHFPQHLTVANDLDLMAWASTYEGKKLWLLSYVQGLGAISIPLICFFHIQWQPRPVWWITQTENLELERLTIVVCLFLLQRQ